MRCALIVLVVAACASCLGPGRARMAAISTEARAAAKAQLASQTTREPGTGMWKLSYNGQTHRWLIVRKGATLHIEPARHWGQWSIDYYEGTPASDAAGDGTVWDLRHHISSNSRSSATSPNVARLTFGPDFREMKIVWSNIQKEGGLAGLLRSAIESEDIVANGTLGAWPNP